MGSGTQLASMPRTVLRVSLGVSVLVKKPGRAAGWAGAYAAMSLRCCPLTVMFMDVYRPLAASFCVALMRSHALCRSSPLLRSMAECGMMIMVPP